MQKIYLKISILVYLASTGRSYRSYLREILRGINNQKIIRTEILNTNRPPGAN